MNLTLKMVFLQSNNQRHFNRAIGTLLTLFIITASVALAQNGGSKRKEANQLADKVGQLVDLSAKRSVLRFNGNFTNMLNTSQWGTHPPLSRHILIFFSSCSGNKFRDYAKSAPRNYSIIVMFTALSAQRQCAICKQASDEYQLVANSYR